jgi:hypothetical protein
MRASCGSASKVFFCSCCSLFRLVHFCPDAGTYWRGSCVVLVLPCPGAARYVTYVADGTALWSFGEWDVVLCSAHFADGEVA